MQPDAMSGMLMSGLHSFSIEAREILYIVLQPPWPQPDAMTMSVPASSASSSSAAVVWSAR